LGPFGPLDDIDERGTLGKCRLGGVNRLSGGIFCGDECLEFLALCGVRTRLFEVATEFGYVTGGVKLRKRFGVRTAFRNRGRVLRLN
jgi:hypothetical protein